MQENLGTHQRKLLDFIDRLDKAIIRTARDKMETSSDYDRALMGLWRIISHNSFCAISDSHEKQKFYSIAANARLILECIADAEYLAKNLNEAASYWKNQQEIQRDLISRADRWGAFTSGSVNQYGQLNERTKNRIRSTLGEDFMGIYNFLCFFTHPNIAGVFWLASDQTAVNARFVINKIIQLLDRFIQVVDQNTDFEISAQSFRKELKSTYDALGFTENEIKL